MKNRAERLSIGLVCGLALTVAGLAVSFWLAFAGFIAVLVMAVLLEQEIRLIGREKLGSLPINAWLAGTARRRH